MKLAMLAQGYLFDETTSINGSLVQLYNLCQGFKENGLEVYYVVKTLDLTKPDYEEKNGIHFYWIKSKKNILQWKSLIESYNDVLIKIQPDALYSRGRNVLQYVAGEYAKKNEITYVWGTNGDDSAEFWKKTFLLKASQKSFLKKIALFPFALWEDTYINKGMRMADYIVNQNVYQKAQTLKFLNKEGILLNSYYHIEEIVSNSKQKQILWMARWSSEKQPLMFLEMISKIGFKNYSIVMAGDTVDSKLKYEVSSKAKKMNVSIPGTIKYKNINDYFSKSLLFVSTSKKEGVSNTFIEAMLHGVPVFSLNSNPNNWLSDYNIGFCSNGNLDLLAAKIEETVNDSEKLKSMQNNAIEFAKDQFSDNKIIEVYIELFRCKWK